MSNSETFNLTVYSGSTKPYVEYNGDITRCRYRIDWDMLFQGKNKLYKTCFVRMQCVGRAIIAKEFIASSVGQISVVGLGYNKSWSPDVPGLVLSPIQVSDSLPIVESGPGYYINTSTLENVVAPQISPPQGIGSITVNFSLPDGTAMATGRLSAYTLDLYFELRDPIEATVEPSLRQLRR